MKNNIEIIPFSFVCPPGIPGSVFAFICVVVLPLVILDYICMYIPGYRGILGNRDMYMHPDGSVRCYPPR